MNTSNTSNANTNISNSTNNEQSGLNINQNPYINQNSNQSTQNTTQNINTAQQNTVFNGDFLKGALIGAALTYVLTNKNAQENILKAFEKGKEFLGATFEELKERVEDAKASMNASKEEV